MFCASATQTLSVASQTSACDHPQATSDSPTTMTTGRIQQLQPAIVCVFVIGQAREAKCVRVAAPARANETGQNRTSHFLPLPLVKLPIFTPLALELLCLSP